MPKDKVKVSLSLTFFVIFCHKYLQILILRWIIATWTRFWWSECAELAFIWKLLLCNCTVIDLMYLIIKKWNNVKIFALILLNLFSFSPKTGSQTKKFFRTKPNLSLLKKTTLLCFVWTIVKKQKKMRNDGVDFWIYTVTKVLPVP